mgnify:CR=1 FL=1
MLPSLAPNPIEVYLWHVVPYDSGRIGRFPDRGIVSVESI